MVPSMEFEVWVQLGIGFWEFGNWACYVLGNAPVIPGAPNAYLVEFAGIVKRAKPDGRDQGWYDSSGSHAMISAW